MKQKFLEKYRTPNALKVIYTLFSVLFTYLLFDLNVFYSIRRAMYEFVQYGDRNVFKIFQLNFGDGIQVLVKVLAICAILTGLVFMWLDRPAISAGCTCLPLLILIVPLITNCFGKDGIWAWGDNNLLVYVSLVPAYYILLGLFSALLIVCIISCILTKKEPHVSVFSSIKNNCLNYKTPAVIKVFMIIKLVLMQVWLFVIKVYRDVYTEANIFYPFRNYKGYFSSNNGIIIAIELLVVISAVAGVILIWMNNAKIAAVCSAIPLIIVITSTALKTTQYPGLLRTDFYYLIWVPAITLNILAFLSVSFTREVTKDDRQKDIGKPEYTQIRQTVYDGVPGVTELSAINELERLKVLLDSNAITQEEYDLLKNQIINRIASPKDMSVASGKKD